MIVEYTEAQITLTLPEEGVRNGWIVLTVTPTEVSDVIYEPQHSLLLQLAFGYVTKIGKK